MDGIPRFSCPALLFLSRLWCSKNKKSQSLWTLLSEVGEDCTSQPPSERPHCLYSIDRMQKSKCYGSQKCLCSEKDYSTKSSWNSGTLFCGKSVPNTAYRGKWLSFERMSQSSRCNCLGTAWLNVKFKLVSVKIQIFISHHPALN